MLRIRRRPEATRHAQVLTNGDHARLERATFERERKGHRRQVAFNQTWALYHPIAAFADQGKYLAGAFE